MRNADAVRKVEGARTFENDFDNALDRQQFFRCGVGFQRSALYVFHDDVTQGIVNRRIVNLRDVRMRQLADQRGFVEEKMFVQPSARGVFENFRRGDLDGDLTLGKSVHAQINRRCGAFTQCADQVVFADLVHGVPAVGDIRLCLCVRDGAGDFRPRTANGGAYLLRRGAADVVAGRQGAFDG